MAETAGTRIRRLAREKGLGDGQDLAAKIGVSYETLRKWTEGESAPNRARQKVISELLGVPAEVFMYGVEALQSVADGSRLQIEEGLGVIARTVGELSGMRLTMARAALHTLIDAPEMLDDAVAQITRLVADEAESRKRTGTGG
ncbi:MAG: helix-turn-helix transcriptional regulator [Burkholderiales bacterium]|nr:helix-turn-helix transcriptional regulator [Burkholderiales bacterium]